MPREAWGQITRTAVTAAIHAAGVAAGAGPLAAAVDTAAAGDAADQVRRPVVLFFDTFEQTGPFLEPWLQEGRSLAAAAAGRDPTAPVRPRIVGSECVY